MKGQKVKVYKLLYAVGSYHRAHNRKIRGENDDRMRGELICRAKSLVHATIILRNLVGHPSFDILTIHVQENNTWRLISDKSS